MEEKNVNFPFEIVDVETEAAAKVKKYFTAPGSGYVLVGPQKYFFRNGFKQVGPRIYNMEVRPTDTFVVTFPKSGTTWTQELVWLLGNDFDYETAKSEFLTERFPFLDITMFFNREEWEPYIVSTLGPDSKVLKFLEMFKECPCEVLEKMPRESRRFIKSHLPLSLLPPAMLETAKVVYVARDPRDVAVSFYYHTKLLTIMGFNGDFKTYWGFFIKNMIDWSPYFSHVKEAWAKRNHPNMLFLFYEELSKDLPSCIRRVADHMGKSVNDEQMARLCDHLSFEKFKNNESVNYENLREFGVLSQDGAFVRKGKSGGWREHFDEDMAAQAQRWIGDNLRGTDLRFPTV